MAKARPKNWLVTAWHDPVGSKVIAAGIIAVLAVAGTTILGLWPAVWSAIAGAFHFLAATSAVPRWLLAILGFCALVVALVTCLLIRDFCFSKWRQYRSDTFDRVEWRWEYSWRGVILYLRPHCPGCQCRMVPTEYRDGNWQPFVRFDCDSCKRKYGPLEGPYRQLAESIERRIDHKLQTDEWSKVVTAKT
jgi:hypothetical protein